MSPVSLTSCRSCSALIRWVATIPAGKAMPLDPDPCPAGNFVFTDEGAEDGPVRALTAEQLAGPADRYRYKSHFATCPQSRTWRKGVTEKALQRTRERVEGES